MNEKNRTRRMHMSKTEKDIWDRSNDISYLEIYDIETKETKIVAKFDYLIEAPNWSHDGTYLVYNSGGHIYRFDLETGTSTLIDTGFLDACNNDHVLSPCGTKIAVSHNTREDDASRIYILPIEGGQPTLITPIGPSYLHGWSNDGKTLAYAAIREGKFDIFTIPATGGVEKRLTSTSILNDGCEYDKVDEYIWFNSVRTGLMQAWRMKTDGSEKTQMTFDEGWNTWFPHISPDRTKVSMLCYKKGDLEPWEHLPHRNIELRLMDADGSNLETVAAFFGGQGTVNVNSWSPCSKKFAYVRYELPQE